jgi:uncharacterized paraquat-inducible protein A
MPWFTRRRPRCPSCGAALDTRDVTFVRTQQCPSCGVYLEPDRKWSLLFAFVGVLIGTWLYGNFSWTKLGVVVALFLAFGAAFGFAFQRYKIQGRPKNSG